MLLNKTDCKVENKCRIPEGTYRARVIGTKFDKTNSKGNPMTTLECEIISPEIINDESGQEQNIAGRPFNLYLSHVLTISGNQRQSGQAQVFQFMGKLGLNEMLEGNEESGLQYDTDKHREYFLGMEFDIALKCEQDYKRAKADRAAGERVGKILTDSNGEKLTDGWKINAFVSDVLEQCNPERNDAIANAAY